MFGFGSQELIIIQVALIPVLIIYGLGYYAGKSRGFKAGLEYTKSLKNDDAPK